MSDESLDLTAVAQESKQTKVATVDPVKSFLSGGIGGTFAVLVGHPFDLTKTRLQTAPPGTYTGGLDVVKQTLARDGVRGCVGCPSQLTAGCTAASPRLWSA